MILHTLLWLNARSYYSKRQWRTEVGNRLFNRTRQYLNPGHHQSATSRKYSLAIVGSLTLLSHYNNLARGAFVNLAIIPLLIMANVTCCIAESEPGHSWTRLNLIDRFSGNTETFTAHAEKWLADLASAETGTAANINLALDLGSVLNLQVLKAEVERMIDRHPFGRNDPGSDLLLETAKKINERLALALVAPEVSEGLIESRDLTSEDAAGVNFFFHQLMLYIDQDAFVEAASALQSDGLNRTSAQLSAIADEWHAHRRELVAISNAVLQKTGECRIIKHADGGRYFVQYLPPSDFHWRELQLCPGHPSAFCSFLRGRSAMTQIVNLPSPVSRQSSADF